MIEWARVPWSLWAYAVLTIGSLFASLVGVSTPVAPLIFAIVLVLAWTYFLLRGVRWLWIATVAVDIIGLMTSLIFGPRTWHGIAVGGISLALLLLPATRRFFDRGETALTGPGAQPPRP